MKNAPLLVILTLVACKTGTVPLGAQCAATTECISGSACVGGRCAKIDTGTGVGAPVITSITGAAANGRVARDGVLVIAGQNLAGATAAKLVNLAGSTIADLVIGTAAAAEVRATLPSTFAIALPASSVILQLTTAAGTATRDVSILQGEPGVKGDTGAAGATGSPGATGATGASFSSPATVLTLSAQYGFDMNDGVPPTLGVGAYASSATAPCAAANRGEVRILIEEYDDGAGIDMLCFCQGRDTSIGPIGQIMPVTFEWRCMR